MLIYSEPTRGQQYNNNNNCQFKYKSRSGWLMELLLLLLLSYKHHHHCRLMSFNRFFAISIFCFVVHIISCRLIRERALFLHVEWARSCQILTLYCRDKRSRYTMGVITSTCLPLWTLWLYISKWVSISLCDERSLTMIINRSLFCNIK